MDVAMSASLFWLAYVFFSFPPSLVFAFSFFALSPGGASGELAARGRPAGDGWVSWLAGWPVGWLALSHQMMMDEREGA